MNLFIIVFNCFLKDLVISVSRCFSACVITPSVWADLKSLFLMNIILKYVLLLVADNRRAGVLFQALSGSLWWSQVLWGRLSYREVQVVRTTEPMVANDCQQGTKALTESVGCEPSKQSLRELGSELYSHLALGWLPPCKSWLRSQERTLVENSCFISIYITDW